MGTCPYVSARRSWNSEKKDYEYKQITIGERHFDGIETDYSSLFVVTPDEARYIANDLWNLAEQIDGKQKKDSILKTIRKNNDKIIAAAKKEAMA